MASGLTGGAGEDTQLSEQQVGPLGATGDRLERHPSWLELFFDLVFVAAIAALARQLHDDHSVAGLAVFVGLFVPVWWAWRGFAWYATGFDTDDRTFRAACLAGMIGVAAVSAGIDGAAHGDSETFVIAYSGLLCVLAALFLRTWWRVPAARPLAARQAISRDHRGCRRGGFAVEAVVGEDALTLADRLPLGAGLASYLIAMGSIRAVTRQLDWVALMRIGLAGTMLAFALTGLGLAPLAFVAVIAALLVAEAAIELTHAAPDHSQDST